jgi:hypothetical protein
MAAAPVFAFGLVAFGFLGMGPVTIAVEGKRIHPYGLYTTPTVLAGCPHFYRKEAHND